MTSCKNCTALNPDGECAIFSRRPPPGYAAKCKHYQEVESIEPEIEEPAASGLCEGCENNQDGYCLRHDLAEWRYNFVKIRDGIACPKE